MCRGNRPGHSRPKVSSESSTNSRTSSRPVFSAGVSQRIGVPDCETYVAHRKANHPGQPMMSYVEFFRERRQARYTVGKGRFSGLLLTGMPRRAIAA
jgi:uncharacterized short protein YbdD (DUF466 family)